MNGLREGENFSLSPAIYLISENARLTLFPVSGLPAADLGTIKANPMAK